MSQWPLSSLQEIPENAADVAHLAHLHTPCIVSGVDLRYTNSKTWKFLRHDWKVRILQKKDERYTVPHCGCLQSSEEK